MAFQQMGGNAARQDYDYQSGAGMDGFMSRAIDEVSWQTSLGTTYSTLAQLPIGIMPTTSTPTNFDSTQVSGAVGGSISMGSGNNGAGGGTNGRVVIDGANGRISILDSNSNEVVRIGQLDG